MRTLTFIFLSLLCFVTQAAPDYKSAVKELKKYKKEIAKITEECNSDKGLMLSVVFPEITRYSVWRDFMETKGLELLYTTQGKTGADFSIGIFQMKPSFVEDLENNIIAYRLTDAFLIKTIQYNTDNLESIRKERLYRLKSIDWQLRYAAAFCKVIEARFPNLSNLEYENKIAFYAAAYNLGMNESEESIWKWRSRKAFPYGAKFGESYQDAYSDVAVYFYKNFLKEEFGG